MSPDPQKRPNVFMIATSIVVAGIVLFVLYKLSDALLLIFCGVLLAIGLSSLGQLINKVSKIPYKASTIIGFVIIIGIGALLLYLTVPQFISYVQQPQSADNITKTIETKIQDAGYEGFNLQQYLPVSVLEEQGFFQSSLFMGLASTGRDVVTVLFDILIVMVIALFFAINPQLYLNTVNRFAVPEKRAHYRTVLTNISRTFQKWIVARFASMGVVFVLTLIALFIIGMPLVLPLALLAGLLSFIPNFGPLLSVIPAAFVAITISPEQLIAVVIAYIVVQVIESYFITPKIEQKAVLIPPAGVLIAQLCFGVLFGFVGLLVATPLAIFVTATLFEFNVIYRNGESNKSTQP